MTNPKDAQGGGARSPGSGGGSAPENDETSTIAYADAMAELEGILGELERTDVDVDILADRVHRATQLIAHCRERIHQAQLEVEDAVASLDPSTTNDGASDGDDQGSAGETISSVTDGEDGNPADGPG